MNNLLGAAIATVVLAAVVSPSQARELALPKWTGGYLGVHYGYAEAPDDSFGDRILFDTNLDGHFGETVNTADGVDAFSPGFCNGAARAAVPGGGCSRNEGGADWGVRAGYDWQVGHWVWGLVGEYSMNDVRDAVSAFSTAPAYYTMYRKIDDMFAVRGRVGFAFGAGENNLMYATAGWAYAKIKTGFGTSNRVNAFSNNGVKDEAGMQWGVGYERQIGDAFTVGVEYLLTQIDDDSYRVHAARGTAPATNPFVQVNADGTTFRRSDTDFDFDSLRLTGTYRF